MLILWAVSIFKCQVMMENAVFLDMLDWIIEHLVFVFTSHVTVLCLRGDSDSVLFPLHRRWKRKRRTSIWCLLYCVPAFSFMRELWYSEVCLPGLLYYMMTGIPLTDVSPTEQPATWFYVPSLFINVWHVSYSRGLQLPACIFNLSNVWF